MVARLEFAHESTCHASPGTAVVFGQPDRVRHAKPAKRRVIALSDHQPAPGLRGGTVFGEHPTVLRHAPVHAQTGQGRIAARIKPFGVHPVRHANRKPGSAQDVYLQPGSHRCQPGQQSAGIHADAQSGTPIQPGLGAACHQRSGRTTHSSHNEIAAPCAFIPGQRAVAERGNPGWSRARRGQTDFVVQTRW